VLNRFTVIRGADGEAARLIGVISDVTEERRQEVELRAWKGRYDSAARASRQILYDDDDSGEVIWGGAVESLLGCGAEDIGGVAGWLDRVHPDDREEVLSHAKHVHAQGEPFHIEYRVRREDGSYIHVEDFGLLVPNADGTLSRRIIGFIGDVSERVRDKAEIRRQNTELARSNQDLERFAYLASHDLQEPLRMVSSYVQLLSRRYQGKLGPEADEYIGFAVEGVGRMRTLIQDLLQYSRVNTRPRELVEVSVADVIERVARNLEVAIGEAHARVEVVGTLPALHGDRSQLTMLFQNLIANGIKFRRPETPAHITISASHESGHGAGFAGERLSGSAGGTSIGLSVGPPQSPDTSSTETPGAMCRFCIRDNGIGIESQHFDRIFQMFQRLHTRRDYPGNGIGLAICKRIVEGHGGRIWIESQVGQGTAFYFTLPLATAAASGPMVSAAVPVPLVEVHSAPRHEPAAAPDVLFSPSN
jgi:PAS domain S-box-containing protein